ncbi:hypothetical protein MMC30_006841 [Trapelia coarctata]|nr:hypothetical protein [Trapelia coarctata]
MVRGRSEINNKIRGFLSHRFARSTAQTASAASAPVVGVSGPVGSTGHAAAFSRAVAQASQRVDHVLKDIEHNNTSIPSFQAIVTFGLPKALTLLLVDYTEFVDYIARVERYPNHRLPQSLAPCTLSTSEWHEIKIAAEASTAVYGCPGPTEARELVPAAWNGTTKTMTLETRSLNGNNTLVIAVRGSVTMMDWAVNANSEPAEAPELGEHSVCHRGFLDVARRMDETAEQVIRRSIPKTDEPITLLFTGHSAGAAVAQLLFAFVYSKMTSLSKIVSDFKKIDCITFAGPPIALPPIQCPTGSVFLSIVNEGDPVPLAQTKYVESLLEAYARPPPAEAVDWELPDPYYSLSGTCILLRDTAPDDPDALDIQPFTLEPEALNKALFGNLMLHSMTEYCDRIIVLEKRAAKPDLLESE